MNIIELAISAQLIDHRDTEESLPPDFVASLKEFATLVRAQALEEFVAATVDLGYVSQAYADDFAAAIRQLKETK